MISELYMPEVKKEKLTLKEAIDLSILKWKYLSKYDKKMPPISLRNKLDHLTFGCGLCHYFFEGKSGAEINLFHGVDWIYDKCSKCPLNYKERGNCFQEDSLYRDWQEESNPEDRKRTAKTILDILYIIKGEYEDGLLEDL